MQVRCSFETRATPAQVFHAYTDFTDRRLETWRDTLKPENYSLHESGASWAVVREGSLRMGVVLRYEWSEPSTVRWSILESNLCDHGGGELTVRPAAGGGAHVDIRIEEGGGKGMLGRLVLGLKSLLGPSVLRRASKGTLDRIADEGQPVG
jgi:polyketide cyclase/dehydrase/lipid transport protein